MPAAATGRRFPGHIVLVGMMGSGKTAVGHALAARLGVRYADNDEALVARVGREAAAFAREKGVAALHGVEHDILLDALASDDNAVVGAPGSVALDPRAPNLLRGQRVVWLRATLGTLAGRTRRDPVRPLLGEDPAAALPALMTEREPAFARLATMVVDVDDLTVDAIVELMLADGQGRKSIESPNSCQR